MASKPVLHAVEAWNDPVKDARAGISVMPYNSRQLEDALQYLCAASSDELAAMGSNGLKYALDNLDWNILGKKYSKLIDKL